MRYIIVFVHALAAVIYQLIFGDPVTATAKAPDSITPGQNFIVEVTIHKPQVVGFAKLQIELPVDYIASEGDSKGGNFSLSGTTAKIIWTAIPSDENMVVKINVTAPSSANGNKELIGKFSYIENNVKQQVDIAPVMLNMGGSSSESPVATTETTPTPETQKVAGETSSGATTTNTEDAQAFSKPTEPDAAISIRRQVTAFNVPNNFEITLIVQKGSIKGFAKIAEKVPEGFIATQVATSEASFAFEGGMVKFIWASLPSSEEITITYKLSPDPNGGIQNPSIIQGGAFSYIENNQTQKTTIPQESLSTTPTNKVAVAVNTNVSTVNESVATTNTSSVSENNMNSSAKETESVSNTQASAPQNGNIHYAVQIGAFKNGVNANALKQKYGIGETVRTEMAEGFTKCVYGKFAEYKMARDSREAAKSKGIDGAFVTAYNSGKRITVQEALMVSNQKWYK